MTELYIRVAVMFLTLRMPEIMYNQNSSPPPPYPPTLHQARKIKRKRFSFCADKSLARPVGKEATGTEDFEFHIFYL